MYFLVDVVRDLISTGLGGSIFRVALTFFFSFKCETLPLKQLVSEEASHKTSNPGDAHIEMVIPQLLSLPQPALLSPSRGPMRITRLCLRLNGAHFQKCRGSTLQAPRKEEGKRSDDNPAACENPSVTV